MNAVHTPFPLRLFRCAFLHADTYEEVEADPPSIGQALAIVLVSCMVAAAGAWLETLTWRPEAAASRLGLWLEVIARGVEPLILWLGGGAFAFMVGSSFFRGPETETDYAEVLRTTGFAFTPGWLAFLVMVPPPVLGVSLMWIVRAWVLLAFMIAVRQALDFTTGRAVGTVLSGWVLGWLVMWGAVSVSVQLMALLG